MDQAECGISDGSRHCTNTRNREKRNSKGPGKKDAPIRKQLLSLVYYPDPKFAVSGPTFFHDLRIIVVCLAKVILPEGRFSTDGRISPALAHNHFLSTS